MRIASGLVGVVHLRRRRWLARAVLAALWIGAAVVVAEGQAGPCWTPFALLAGTSLVLGYTRGRSIAGAEGRGEKGSLGIEGGMVEVEVGGEVRARFPCADVVSGWTEPESWAGQEAAVLVTRRGVEVRIAVPKRGQGARVLEAAGVAAGQRAVKIHVQPSGSGGDRALRLFFAIVTTLIFAASLMMTVWFYVGSSGGEVWDLVRLFVCIAVGAGAWRIARWLFATTLTIGADGVAVNRRFVRRADLEGARVEPGALVLDRKGLPPLRIRASLGAAEAAAARIHEALRASLPAEARLEALDRGGRSTAAWLGELRALGAARQGYRTASVDRADIVAAVKDGAAPVERRIAAAVALSAGGDDEARAALRVAVDTCVDDGLRRALEQAAAGEMEAALDEVAPRARRA